MRKQREKQEDEKTMCYTVNTHKFEKIDERQD